MTRDDWLQHLRTQFAQLAPAAALRAQQGGALLIDVREPDEWLAGIAIGAHLVPRGQLEFRIDQLAELHRPLILTCAAGGRALLAAESLQRLGYSNLSVIDGGMRAWVAAGLPLQAHGDDAAWRYRYSRQIALPQVGLEGQRRLKAARVLVVGAGGLGSPAALYLAAAGIGTLRIADADVVDASNLQRQVLHTEARVGRPKTESAAATLTALNPALKLELHEAYATSANIDTLVEGCDVLIDGSDNLPTRYLLNDAAIKHGKPLVYAAVERFVGQISVFHPSSARGTAPCYRCLFPEPPPSHDAPNCAELGVLGVVPGVLGTWQACEALKLMAGVGAPLIGRMLTIDFLQSTVRETRLRADPGCLWCAPERAFPGYVDYAAWCAAI